MIQQELDKPDGQPLFLESTVMLLFLLTAGDELLHEKNKGQVAHVCAYIASLISIHETQAASQHK